VEAFVQHLCTELLPPRCSLPSKTSTEEGSDSEFRKAVEELVKSKLEKPKRCVRAQELCAQCLCAWKMMLDYALFVHAL